MLPMGEIGEYLVLPSGVVPAQFLLNEWFDRIQEVLPAIALGQAEANTAQEEVIQVMYIFAAGRPAQFGPRHWLAGDRPLFCRRNA